MNHGWGVEVIFYKVLHIEGDHSRVHVIIYTNAQSLLFNSLFAFQRILICEKIPHTLIHMCMLPSIRDNNAYWSLVVLMILKHSSGNYTSPESMVIVKFGFYVVNYGITKHFQC